MWMRGAGVIGLALLISACSGQQSALEPHGPEAEHIACLFWIFTAVCGAIWFAVMVVLAVGLARPAPQRLAPLALDVPAERRTTMVVGGAVVWTPLTVSSCRELSFAFQPQLGACENPAVNIKV